MDYPKLDKDSSIIMFSLQIILFLKLLYLRRISRHFSSVTYELWIFFGRASNWFYD